MNLEDVVDPEYGLQQDDWSLTAPSFGEEGQLEVVGWSGKSNSYTKFYIIKCGFCSKDSELFGEGYFRNGKGNLTKGSLPCGCAKNPRWSKDQYTVLCSRKATQLGYTFAGFTGDWRGAHTKIKILCEKHGEWSSGSVDSLLRGRGCPHCKAANSNRKPDTEMVQRFFSSGAFHPETKFSRVQKVVQGSFKTVWSVYCPVCDMSVESIGSNLKRGHLPCGCSTQNTTEAYIQIVSTDALPVALKFGVSKRSKARVKETGNKTVMDVEIFAVYKFDEMKSCRNAERGCRRELDCGVLSKEEFPDGYTETTWGLQLG